MHQCLSMKLLPRSKFYTWLQELAKPKPTKEVWNFHPKLIWGNQETIWPLPSRSLLRQPSSRILTLARPKETVDKQMRSLYLYSCGQTSEIWKRSSTVYSALPSKRLLKLAEPRPISATYLKLRPRISPVWPISSSALCCKASTRILTLAQARSIHPNFKFPEQSEREISKAARRAEATPRLQQLAQPVVRKQIQFYENTSMEAPIRQIPLTALQAVPSPRLLELARPKVIPCESAMDRSPEWPVSAAAKQAVASPRLTELSHSPNSFPQSGVYQLHVPEFLASCTKICWRFQFQGTEVLDTELRKSDWLRITQLTSTPLREN
ncbi:testicular haploid expressed gene protein-like isoform X1 [Ahaetulla prasina]|uniref:testicular haploid expressed gene protein-like isoform X1 n=1 Tax=Ahaetulla prasina TaxID=499056 RepID=UPI00264779C7|nr:testicular haploid expressed gene protein-like isoform X1 [Ahaetulla prasina]